MATRIEVNDEEPLLAFLRSRPETIRKLASVQILHRAAMRAMPLLLLEKLVAKPESDVSEIVLPVLRSFLTSAVWVLSPSPTMTQVAASLALRDREMRGKSTIIYAPISVVAVESDDTAGYAAARISGIQSLFPPCWLFIHNDTRMIGSDALPDDIPLWFSLPDRDNLLGENVVTIAEPATWSKAAWTNIRYSLSQRPGYDFWLRWYEAARDGRPLTGDWDHHRQLLTDIARISNADWELGAEHIAGLIAEIEKRYRPDRDVVIQAVTLEVSVVEVQRAVCVNRQTLPPTFDAISGHIELEIRRLQGINCWESEAQCEEARSLIRRLTAMAQAVQELQKSVEESSTEPTRAEATRTKSLAELYAGHLKSWPRDNAADLTDSVWRLGLSGLSIAGLTLCGVPMTPAVMLAGALFGGKKLTDALKAGADSKSVIGD